MLREFSCAYRPPPAREWLQHHALFAFVGGAEANVATALANGNNRLAVLPR